MARDIDSRLERAFEDITPDVLGRVLLTLDQRELSAHTADPQAPVTHAFTDPKRRPRTRAWRRWAIGVAAMLMLIFGGQLAYGNLLVASTINFDVNPSIQMTVNRKEKIISAQALNPDAEVILDNMNLKNVDLDIAVNALIGSMLKNGYLTDIANSILISVESQDSAKAAQLQERLSLSVSDLLSAYAIDGAVISQSYAGKDEPIEALAREYGISYSKAELAYKLAATDPTLLFADLASLPVNDINLLMTEQAHIDGVTRGGHASSAAYIGMDAATGIALAHAGLTADQASLTQSKLDYDDGRMIYEIEFHAGSAEYEYDIDALTGDIVDFDSDALENSDRDDDAKHQTQAEESPSGPADRYIGADAAKAIALAHAKLSDADVRFEKVKLDDDDDGAVYQLKFESDSMEYKYEIDAQTGAILEAEADDD